MRRIFFFATPSDIIPVLSRFEANAPLKFVALGSFDTPNLPIFLTSSDLPSPGISTHETGSISAGYLVSIRDTKNNMEKVPQLAGGTRWMVYNGGNEESVSLNFAGRWKDMLLPGGMSTLHDTAVAQQLMKWFLSSLRKEHFTKVKSWWLGPEALALWQSGTRLSTTAEQSPPEFDLAPT